ncbi:hypothetical protein BGX33_011733 [Mortierella sp. NVP41]|nr:hypothetical protein BGX33_011733 [Mortierella sp. NVP41]
MSDSSKNNNNKPRVLIVGAGLGGLFLGALLERIDVPYTIFERTSTIKPLGSALSVGPPVLAMFEQLGMIDEIKRIGKRFTHVMDYSVDLKHVSPKSYIELEALTGYPQYIVSRPALHEILLKQIPSHKILLNKQIVIISETDDKVTIQATDDTVYEGELLVGADGAYSAVRQQLYAFLKKEGKLPEADHEELPFNCTCLVGQTTPLDPEEYPQLKLPLCQFLATQGLDVAPYSWVVFTTAQNTICWMVAHQLYETMNKTTLEQQAKDTGNPEWGAFAVQSTCDDTRSLLVPINDNKGNPLTVGDLYEKTPKEGISKVMLEEKVFETWYHGRTVLIGDGEARATLNTFM